jgi:hypothetical protein
MGSKRFSWRMTSQLPVDAPRADHSVEPSPDVEPIHDRMPLVLEDANLARGGTGRSDRPASATARRGFEVPCPGSGISRPTMIARTESQPEIRSYGTATMHFRARALAVRWPYSSARYRFDAYATPIGRAASSTSPRFCILPSGPRIGRCGSVTRP